MNAILINHATLVAHQRRLQEVADYLRQNDLRMPGVLLKAIEEVDEWLTDPQRQAK